MKNVDSERDWKKFVFTYDPRHMEKAPIYSIVKLARQYGTYQFFEAYTEGGIVIILAPDKESASRIAESAGFVDLELA